MNKLFTLIEMIVVIVILSLLAAIIIPNTADTKDDAFVSSVHSNIRNLQTGVDFYKMKQGEFPSESQPTIYEPQLIDFDILYPKYMRNKPKDLNRVFYWVDYQGQVWGSTILPPEIEDKNSSINWERDSRATGYEVFEVNENNANTTSLKNKSVIKSVKTFNLKDEKELTFPKEPNKGYLVSAIDSYGLPSAPAGTPFSKEGNSNILSEGRLFTNGSSNFYLKENGDVVVWGYNSQYSLGINHASTVYIPIIHPYLKDIKALFINGATGAAIDKDGYTYMWGYGGGATPTKVPELGTNAKEVIAAGNKFFALMKDGTVMSWGENTWGEMGQGHTEDVRRPTLIPNLNNVKEIIVATNTEAVAALRYDGTVISWGKNQYGNLGFYHNSTTEATPKEVPNLSNIKKVAMSNGTTAFLLEDGNIKIVGSNFVGKLGLGHANSYSRALIDQPYVSNAKDIKATYYGFIAIINDGNAMFWGKPFITNSEYHKPVLVKGSTPIVDFKSNSHGMLFKYEDGTFYSPADNDEYRYCLMTNGINSELKENKVTQFTLGSYFSLYELEDGRVMGCGENYHGYMGHTGRNAVHSKPVEIKFPQ